MQEQELAAQRKLFGTNGVRGTIGKEMTAQFAMEMGRAIGSFFEGEIVIGTDARSSKDMLKSAVAAGILSAGCGVVDIGLAPTPAVQYTVGKTSASAGVVITASHNPPEFNGIKVIDSDGIELDFTKELQIEKIFFSKDFRCADWHEAGILRKDDSANRLYAEGIKGVVDAKSIKKAKLKVIIDCANGVAGLVTPGLLADLGVQVKTLNERPDGKSPAHPSEPTPENLKQLIQAVSDEGASFGVAHDGDADRSIFVDENGRYISGDLSFAMMAGYVVSKNPGSTVVSTVATSDCVADMVSKSGGRTVLTRVGSPVIAKKMKEIGAIFGGEESGGLFYSKHQYCKDAAMTTALMAQFVAERGSLSKLVDEVPVYHQTKLKVKCPKDRMKEVMAKMADASAGKKVDLTDGVKIFEGKDWVIIRPSGTEPIFRIFSQSKSEDRAASMAKEYLAKLEGIISASC
jgi:phosphomannomutase / phosphoglucomutase